MAIERYYRHLTARHTVQGAADEYGDAVTAYEGPPFGIMGHIGKPSSGQVQRAAQRGVEVDGRLYTGVDAGVRPYDVIADDDGRVYQVVSAPRDAARRGHHVEADLVELRGVVLDADTV